MTCAKATVRCTLVTADGSQIVGTNWCANPQATCPRLPGEGYEKCRSICDQQGHAEVDAIRIAGPHARGAHAYVEGHTYACQSCQEALFGAGVAALTIGPPPAGWCEAPDRVGALEKALEEIKWRMGRHSPEYKIAADALAGKDLEKGTP